MNRWIGRVAVVTGASSGIGAAISQELVKNGLKVVGLARRVERVEELSRSLKSEKGVLHPLKCDVSKEEEIIKAFQWTKSNLGGVDILVNNAALGSPSTIIGTPAEDLRNMLNLNVMGLTICTQEALKSMKERGVDDGHIVHINSILGHIPALDLTSMYSATKHAVTALTEGLRKELVKQKSKIRITSVSPGLVKTEMPPDEVLTTMPYLEASDIADAVLYVLGVPAHVQIHEIMVKPVGEMF